MILLLKKPIYHHLNEMTLFRVQLLYHHLKEMIHPLMKPIDRPLKMKILFQVQLDYLQKALKFYLIILYFFHPKDQPYYHQE